MNIEFHSTFEEQRRALAANQGRDVCALVEEAVREHIESAALADIDADEVAAAQTALLAELADVPDWKVGDE